MEVVITIVTPYNSITTLHFSFNSESTFLLIFSSPNMGEAPVFYINGFSKFEHEIQQQNHVNDQNHDSSWYEEIIDEDLKWSFKLNRFLITSSNSMYNSSNKKAFYKTLTFCSFLFLLFQQCAS